MMMMLLMTRVNTKTMMTVDNDEVGDHDNVDDEEGDDDDDDDDDDGDDDAKPGRHASFRLTRRPQKAAQPQFLFSPNHHQPHFHFYFCSIFFFFNFSIFCSIYHNLNSLHHHQPNFLLTFVQFFLKH